MAVGLYNRGTWKSLGRRGVVCPADPKEGLSRNLSNNERAWEWKLEKAVLEERTTCAKVLGREVPCYIWGIRQDKREVQEAVFVLLCLFVLFSLREDRGQQPQSPGEEKALESQWVSPLKLTLTLTPRSHQDKSCCNSRGISGIVLRRDLWPLGLNKAAPQSRPHQKVLIKTSPSPTLTPPLPLLWKEIYSFHPGQNFQNQLEI